MHLTCRSGKLLQTADWCIFLSTVEKLTNILRFLIYDHRGGERKHILGCVQELHLLNLHPI
jgi:hypothetical protein